MCTVLLRLSPGAHWPVLLGAIRDEFADRPWDPPARHWAGGWSPLVGGRDAAAGGTWLAVDPTPGRTAVAALLNGVRRPPLPDGAARPTRGTLALDILASDVAPTASAVRDHDGFHLVRATSAGADVWSWDGDALNHRLLTAGEHIIVNLGVDAADDPLVPHFAPLLASLPEPLLPPGTTTNAAWEPWTDLLQGDGLDPADPRALIVHRVIDERVYASTSAALIGLADAGVRYDFCTAPGDPQAWAEVHL